MSYWGTVLAVSAFLAVGVACSSTTSAPAGPADTGADAGQGGTYGASACGTCVAAACSTAIATCNGDPTCAAHLTCLDACVVTATGDADPACEAACPAPSGSAGTSAQAGLTTCRTQGAGAACGACGVADGGSDASAACVANPVLKQTCAASTQPNPCNKCQFEKCCDSVKKVFDGGPATDFGDCFLACAAHDIVCYGECEKKYPTGIKGFGEYQACLEVNCQATGACQVSSKCAECEFQKCGCELTNCKVDPSCLHINECVGSCDTPSCAAKCTDAMPAASVALYNSLSICTTQKCLDVCNGK